MYYITEVDDMIIFLELIRLFLSCSSAKITALVDDASLANCQAKSPNLSLKGLKFN